MTDSGITGPQLIRAVRERDLPAIAELQRASILGLTLGTYGAERGVAWAEFLARWNGELLERGQLLLAERDSGPVAVGGWSPHEDSPEAAWMVPIFVAPSQVRKGLGRLMIEASESSGKSAGREIYWARASLNAVPFYRAMGYEAIGERDWAPEPGRELPFMLMRKDPQASEAADTP